MVVNKTLDVILSGGVEIRGLKASAIARRKPAGEPVLEQYKFIANTDRAEATICDIVRLSTHISMENHLGIKIKTLELFDENDPVLIEELLSPLISESLGDLPLIQADINIVSNTSFEDEVLASNIAVIETKKIGDDTNALLAVGHKLLTPSRAENLSLLVVAVKEGGFILTCEDASQTESLQEYAQSKGLNVVLEKKAGNTLYILLRKRIKAPKKTVVIHISNDTFDWVDEMHKTMTEELESGNADTLRIVYVSEGDFDNGKFTFYNFNMSSKIIVRFFLKIETYD